MSKIISLGELVANVESKSGDIALANTPEEKTLKVIDFGKAVQEVFLKKNANLAPNSEITSGTVLLYDYKVDPNDKKSADTFETIDKEINRAREKTIAEIDLEYTNIGTSKAAA